MLPVLKSRLQATIQATSRIFRRWSQLQAASSAKDLRAEVRAALQEFDMAIAFHEVWKPAAYDKSLHERMGVSLATKRSTWCKHASAEMCSH